MTITQRKPQNKPDDIPIVNEPGDLYQCDSCACDLTHTIRIKCADSACEGGDGVDICPSCFCAGKEFGNHKRGHAYRVIEINSYPIFTEDWGADEELLLVKGIATQGFGNWKKIAEVVGTRTKEEVETHYNSTYIESANWPLPPMGRHFDVDPEEFQERKRRRISQINAAPIPPQKPTPVSLPGIHEVSGFFPGRLEFEHELDNDAEDLVKDLEFGAVFDYGGDAIPEDENDLDVKARLRWEEERRNGGPSNMAGKGVYNGISNGITPNHNSSPSRLPEVKKERQKSDDVQMGTAEGEDETEEVTQPPPIETTDSLAFKFTLLEMYFQRVQKRHEAKTIMYDRGLLEYKKLQAADKKRPREEREILHRLRPFARMQTAADYEVFTADILYEALLRKRIKELQEYRRLGLVTAADIEKYENDVAKRTQAKTAPREYHTSDRLQHRAGGRQSLGPADDRRSHEREGTPKPSGTAPVRKQHQPLNLANSPCLHLLTPGEQTLCSQLRILPKPYLVIKETLVREYARRGGKLRRREARDLVKVDVSKTARVWDFLVQAGFLKITQDTDTNAANTSSVQNSPKPPTTTPAPSIPSTGWQPPP
ncbi:transcriptional adapter 2 [Moniliophthora roreri MCA 2997]|uniref:Transcriptional adapter 2 n=2 Tax=Moniliophthora roreri TaxID=221103 RepID=V2YQS6_MONRO|nr:transcriptional adapter 2 [Moniliophthora roreri MCA 2997]KAI3608050.1 transcriptional adapter 2 [Moniliophthora roreri]